MGIEQLLPLIKSKVSEQNVMRKVDTSTLQRVAIDGNQWMTSTYKLIWREWLDNQADIFITPSEHDDEIMKKQWLKSALFFSCVWLEHKIEPIWVLDGTSPEQKKSTKEKRKKTRDAAHDRYMTLKKKYEDATTSGSDGTWKLDNDVSSDDRTKIISYRMQEKELPRTWASQLRSMLSDVGIVCLKSTDEGEKLACMLYHDGIVQAVYTTDTDALVYKCDHIIPKLSFETDASSSTTSVYNLSGILTELKLTHSEFVDMCILCGTDFNDHIAKIGPVRALELIQTYKSLENLPSVFKKISIDTSVLNYKISREIFKIIPHTQVLDDECKHIAMNLNRDLLQNSSTILEKYLNKYDINLIKMRINNVFP